MSRPIVYSSSFVATCFARMIWEISSDHATFLLSGNDICSRRKSQTHPNIVFTLLSCPSAASFVLDTIGVLGIGSFVCTGQAHVWIARRGAVSEII